MTDTLNKIMKSSIENNDRYQHFNTFNKNPLKTFKRHEHNKHILKERLRLFKGCKLYRNLINRLNRGKRLGTNWHTKENLIKWAKHKVIIDKMIKDIENTFK